jgi:hypothetical protein
VPPADDDADRFTAGAIADGGGRLVLRGRPAAAGSSPQVFLNGLTIEETPAAPLAATVLLALDLNDRSNSGAALTLPGFQEFTLTGANPASQGSPSTRLYGGLSVTLAPAGGSLDDRLRATPADSGAFSHALLLRDFVFGANNSGIDLRIQGLQPNHFYLLEVWSFDTGSTTLRTSDWTVNGATLWDDYPFAGANLPGNDTDYRLAGAFASDAAGELLLSGRAAGGSSPAVFLNALRLSELAPAVAVDLGRPLISEFMAENADGLTDEDGDTSDWIEIWNATPEPVDLTGWHLSDDPAQPAKWAFPAGTTLAAQGFLRVWASGKDRPGNPAALHTNFALAKAAGSHLALFRPGGTSAACEFRDLPAQRENTSYGLFGIAEPLTAGYFLLPTPFAANTTPPVPGFVADTVFDVDRGFHQDPFTVHVTCATPGAAIHYTTDGSEPTTASPQVPAEGIAVTTTTVLRAKAFAPPLAPGNTDTQSYLFPAHVANQLAAPPGWPATWGISSEVNNHDGSGDGTVPADYEMDPEVLQGSLPGFGISEALGDLPALSIVLPPADLLGPNGIYSNPQSVGDAWERACSFELLEPGGQAVHTRCGIRVHGNSSRRPYRMQKHSFRLAFRAQYGDGRLDHKLFDDTPLKRFDKLVLHAFFTDGYGLVSWDANRYRPETALTLRDPFLKRCFADMGGARVAGRHVHLFLNGLYWGIYEMGERIDEVWASDHFGGLPADWDIIAPGESVYVRAGTGTAWDSLFAFLDSADLTNPANYAQVAAQVDLVDFVDDYLLHVHADAEDWPHHNGYAIRNRAPGADQRFRFVPWDQEISFDPLVLVNRLSPGAANTGADKTPGRLFQKLRANAEFRLLFADRAHHHLHHGGALSLEAEQARWQRFATILDRAIVAESARWGDTADATPYGNAVLPANATLRRETHWLPQIAKVRDLHFPALHDPANPNATLPELRAQSPTLYPLTEPPDFALHGGIVAPGFALGISAPAGDVYYTLDGSDPRAAVSGHPVGTLCSGTVALAATGTVKARALAGGEWSALTAATFRVGTAASAANLVVSELHYHPPLAGEEYIELVNSGAETIDLTGVRLEGISFAFPDATLLAPGERLVVVRDLAAFRARYGEGPRVAGTYTGALDNLGEEIAVVGADGVDIVRFRYHDQAPWPEAPDGLGRSLVLRAAGLDPADPANWRSSTAEGGNPGGVDSLPPFGGEPLADADHDGAAALLEHAVGSDDLDPASRPRPRAAIESLTVAGTDDTFFTITTAVRTGADDLELSAEWSPDLVTWQAAVLLGEVIAPDGSSTRRWRAPVASGAHASQFLRIRAAW